MLADSDVLAMKRNAITKCSGCGFPVEGKRQGARHCTNACRQKAYRHRQRALVDPLQIMLELRSRIARDNRIAWEHAVPFAIRAVPGLVIHRCYGPGFPALGRKRQAEQRLQHLERQVATRSALP